MQPTEISQGFGRLPLNDFDKMRDGTRTWKPRQSGVFLRPFPYRFGICLFPAIPYCYTMRRNTTKLAAWLLTAATLTATSSCKTAQQPAAAKASAFALPYEKFTKSKTSCAAYALHDVPLA